MKEKHHFYRRFRLSLMEGGVLAIIACVFLFPSYVKLERTGDNYYTVKLNGIVVGNVGNENDIDSCMIEARKRVVKDSDELTLIDADVEVSGKEVIWGKVDSREKIVSSMADAMRHSIRETLHRSYTVKVNEASVNLGSYEEVQKFLNEALKPYDTNGDYQVELVMDNTREVNVLTTQITQKSERKSEEPVITSAGVDKALDEMFAEVEPTVEKSFDDYFQGLIDITYADTIEVVEAYLMEDELVSANDAVNLMTNEQETQVTYKIQPGDTLSQIALSNDIPLDELVAINDSLEDENTMIRDGQELVITVPEPDLSIVWKDQQVYTEDYEAEIQYVDNDDWYTTKQEVLQEPSAGRREVVAVITHKDGKEDGREIIEENVLAEAVPKIIERGTKIPPTYVKPISGGRLSSGFGSRKSPTKGASSYHKGVDWATPTGTPVYASNGGTVAFAGWASGYGYAVYINHSDGRQTRYGHLSKVLVKSGQTVSQGQKIALSGNTGRSTGPHLHFEIRIGGQAVNPLKYLN